MTAPENAPDISQNEKRGILIVLKREKPIFEFSPPAYGLFVSTKMKYGLLTDCDWCHLREEQYDVRAMSGIEPQDATADEATQQRRVTLIVLLVSRESLKQASKRISQIPGIQRVGRGVFRYTRSYPKLCTSHELPRHIALRKTRTIPTMREAALSEVQIRTYALVTYRFKNPTAKQKKVVERLKRRAVAARLRPSVLLFPHIRAGESRKRFGLDSERPPLGSRDFSQILSQMGAKVERWTRLRLATHSSYSLFRDVVESTISSDINGLEAKIRALRDEARSRDASTRRLKTIYTDLRRRLKDLMMISSVIRHVWGYRSEARVRRLYDLLLAARRVIAERED